MTTRRGFITGLISLVTAPAIVRAGSLMPVKVIVEPYGVGPMMYAYPDLVAEAERRLATARLWQASFFVDMQECRKFVARRPIGATDTHRTRCI